MEIPILAGRNFAPGDNPRSTVIISRRLAERMYGTTDVVGKAFPPEGDATIVGMAGDARVVKIRANNVAEKYSPLDPTEYATYVLLCRARSDATQLLAPMRAAARRADNRLLPQARRMRDDFAERLEGPRISSAVAGAMGLLALLLACVGIFGLVAFDVAQRTREIGIRVALGADRVSIVRLLLSHLAMPVGVGALVGIAGAIVAGRLLSGDPFYLNPLNPNVYVAAVAVLAVAGAAAVSVPARRALRVDPAVVLRHE
jgi:hypothetical protein